MKERRAIDYLNEMYEAASEALSFVGGMDEAAFAGDKLTFKAVVFCHFTIGAAASRLLVNHPEFATEHPDLPWTRICGMGNRILEEVFDLSPSSIWEATYRTLPELLSAIDAVRYWHAQGE
ncbi:HepT-like ribonuclease domain-containing protein [Rhizobium leguminosarum]